MTPGAFSVPMELEWGSRFCLTRFLHANRRPRRRARIRATGWLENALIGEILARDDRDTVEIEQMRTPAFLRQRGAPAWLQQ
jgi:hypothetical protein